MSEISQCPRFRNHHRVCVKISSLSLGPKLEKVDRELERYRE